MWKEWRVLLFFLICSVSNCSKSQDPVDQRARRLSHISTVSTAMIESNWWRHKQSDNTSLYSRKDTNHTWKSDIKNTHLPFCLQAEIMWVSQREEVKMKVRDGERRARHEDKPPDLFMWKKLNTPFMTEDTLYWSFERHTIECKWDCFTVSWHTSPPVYCNVLHWTHDGDTQPHMVPTQGWIMKWQSVNSFMLH